MKKKLGGGGGVVGGRMQRRAEAGLLVSSHSFHVQLTSGLFCAQAPPAAPGPGPAPSLVFCSDKVIDGVLSRSKHQVIFITFEFTNSKKLEVDSRDDELRLNALQELQQHMSILANLLVPKLFKAQPSLSSASHQHIQNYSFKISTELHLKFLQE